MIIYMPISIWLTCFLLLKVLQCFGCVSETVELSQTVGYLLEKTESGRVRAFKSVEYISIYVMGPAPNARFIFVPDKFEMCRFS